MQDMLLGWIHRPDNQMVDKGAQLPFSWLVAAGKNPVSRSSRWLQQHQHAVQQSL
jgi:hypothetical protein